MIANLRPASDAEIERLLSDPAQITRFLYGSGADSRAVLVLGKTWHAVHFALNGSRLGGNEPLNFLVAEGTPVGELDVGFGPARVLTSQQVYAIAALLHSIEPSQFGKCIDLQQLDDHAIYPGGWLSGGRSIDDVVSAYGEMRDFICRLAQDGLGLVLYIN